MVPVSEQKYCTLENSAEDEGTKKGQGKTREARLFRREQETFSQEQQKKTKLAAQT